MTNAVEPDRYHRSFLVCSQRRAWCWRSHVLGGLLDFWQSPAHAFVSAAWTSDRRTLANYHSGPCDNQKTTRFAVSLQCMVHVVHIPTLNCINSNFKPGASLSKVYFSSLGESARQSSGRRNYHAWCRNISSKSHGSRSWRWSRTWWCSRRPVHPGTVLRK